MTLGAYRVFGCYDSVGDDVLIAAYNMAYEDGSDIITASIGGDNGWSEEPWAVAVQRIVEAGVPCPVAAGNEGDYVCVTVVSPPSPPNDRGYPLRRTTFQLTRCWE